MSVGMAEDTGLDSAHVDLERRAAIWEEAVVSSWEERLVPQLIEALELPERGSVLVAECRTGYAAMQLLERVSEDVRCIALDASREMLDVARSKLPAEDRRIWWEAKSINQTHYRNGVFGASVCAAGVLTKDDVYRVCSELVRLTSPGGSVGLVVPLRDTFVEFYDLFREGLIAADLLSLEPSLDAFVDDLFDADALRVDLAGAGLKQVEIHPVNFRLSFESSGEFLLSPLVESLYLPYWMQICKDDATREQVFFHILEAMDTYFLGIGMEVTAEAAWVVGKVEEPS